MHLVGAVRCALPAEVVTLHRARETLALADRGDVDVIARRQHIDLELLADPVLARVVEAKLDQAPACLDAGLGEVAGLRLAQALRLHGP